MQRHLLLLVVTLSGIIGCRAQQLRSDQSQIRQALLDLYTDQALDNLIRVRNNLPIIQLDYSNMTGTVTNVASSEVGGAQTKTDNSFSRIPANGANPAAAAFPIASVFQNLFSYKAAGSQTNQLTVTANPITNNNDIYDAYLEYMSVRERLAEDDRDPSTDVKLTTSDRPHPELIRCYHGRYYWVPQRYAPDFFRLSLVTTAQRGQAVPRPSYFENVIESVLATEKIPGNNPGYRLRLRLKKKIPNDAGKLIVSVNGFEKDFRLQPIAKLDDKPIDPNKSTDQIDLLFDEEPGDGDHPKVTVSDFVKAIDGKDVRIKLENNVPGYPKTDDLLDSIRHQLELQRLDQQAR